VGTPASLIASASSNDGGSLSYLWSILGGCVSADFTTPQAVGSNVTIIGGLVYQVCHTSPPFVFISNEEDD